MPSLLDSMSQLLTPDVTNGIGKSTGLDAGMVTKGLAVAAPLVLGAMARRASTPSGLDGLSTLIPQDGGAGLGNLLRMVGGGGAAPAVLSGIFGAGLGAVGGTVDRKLGFKASSLIAMVAPVVLGLLAKRKATEGLDTPSLGRVLEDEKQAFLAKGGETATLVRSALDAGDRASELRNKFTAEEWTKIRVAPGGGCEARHGRIAFGAGWRHQGSQGCRRSHYGSKGRCRADLAHRVSRSSPRSPRTSWATSAPTGLTTSPSSGTR